MKTGIIVLCIIAAAASVVAATLSVLNYKEVQQLKNGPANVQPPRVNGNFNSVNGQPQQNQQQGNASLQPGGRDVTEHKVYVTRSSDPESFADSTEAVFEKASVPEVVLLTQDSDAGNAGDLLMYFPSFETFTDPGTEQIAYARSTDNGETWSERAAIIIEGDDDVGTAVDPSLVELSDGRLRMYFYGAQFAVGDPSRMEGENNFYSALSSDGVHFTVEDGVRFTAEKITDPDVIEHNGSWIMYISKGPETLIATSNDGLTFSLEEATWAGGGVPGAYVDAENMVHLYGCGKEGIATQESADGVTFDELTQPEAALRSEDTATPIICDPSPVLLPDGDVLMVYKKV